MSKGLFITGTDTGVGKTLIAGGLLLWAKSQNYKVEVMKPIESGAPSKDGKFEPEDSNFLHSLSEDRDVVDNPNIYETPAAPSVAADMEGRPVNVEFIHNRYENLSSRSDCVIVEGAGGLLVPITESFTMADLARDLNLSTILVVGSKLGAINHTLLSIDWMLNNNLPLSGIIINNLSASQDIAARTNPDVIRSLRPDIPFLGVLPYLSMEEKAYPSPDQLLDWINNIPAEKLKYIFGK